MDAFLVSGGSPLSGRIRINGGKNAALPQMAAALLTDEPLKIQDAPDLRDIENMGALLAELGCTVDESNAPIGEQRSVDSGRTLRIQCQDTSNSHARYDVVRKMRASICVLGPMLARRGNARVSLPGGCAIGERPVDIHIRGLEALGARIRLESGDIVADAPVGGRLRGGVVFLGGPFGSTVLGTANVMSAATLAKGRTTIEYAACEPEVTDLAKLLNSMGARISGAGTPRIVIDGVESLHGAEHRVMPDRIEAGTFMAAAAITRSRVELANCPWDSMLAVVDALRRAGVGVEADILTDPHRADCEVAGNGDLKPIQLTTQPHPGFPTDLQAQLMAVASLSSGNSVITERIFPGRFMHVAELARMGASLHHNSDTVVVSGVRSLIGAPVMATDLRASACLVLAGLAARGHTTVNRVYHLDRGYERMEVAMRSLNADIQRIEVEVRTMEPVQAAVA